jgi:GNAT superfamily N-acetyltransferase
VPDPPTLAWLTARYDGFLQEQPNADQVGEVVASWQAEGRTLHAIYDTSARPDAALPVEVPVATAASMAASLDAGGVDGILCTLVADVTVRATHQGRGLMRRLMDAITTATARDGFPLMALHAAHPARYARFGFAPAIRAASIVVDCARFSLRDVPAGAVHEADPRKAEELAGSVGAASTSFGFGALSLSRSGPPRGGSDGLRCLVHTDAAGAVDGVLTYVFRGWTPQAQVLEVVTETYSTLPARAALWQSICSTGIASTVRARDLRADDPLPWMLQDRAAWRVDGLDDGLSLRIVDPATALRQRGYSGPDAALAIEVTDRTGLAAGAWLVSVSGGRAAVEPTTRSPDVTMDVGALAAIFLATTRARTLLDAGRIAATASTADTLDSLLRWPVEAASALHF